MNNIGWLKEAWNTETGSAPPPFPNDFVQATSFVSVSLRLLQPIP